MPMLATAEPGHCPETPHPIPNIVAPIMVLLFRIRSLLLNFPPVNGPFITFGIRLMVSPVTKAAPPITNRRPRSFSCKKLKTISGLVIPLAARPKPNNNPPRNTNRCLNLMVIHPMLEQILRLLYRL